MGKSVAKQLDFDSVETKANARSVRDEQLLPTILKAFLKVFQAHPSQERIVRKYSNIGAFESVNQLLPALARDHQFNGGQDEAALMTTYDILNECMEALEEHEAEHVGADYDETKRSLSSRNRSQLRYTGAGRRLLNTTAQNLVAIALAQIEKLVDRMPESKKELKKQLKKAMSDSSRWATNVPNLLQNYLSWCATHAVADVVTADDSTGTGKWQIQGRQQTPTLSKAASKHLEEIEQLSRQDAEVSSSTVVSSPSAVSHTGDPVCLRSLDDLHRASFWNGRHAGTADYGTVMSTSTKVKDVLASDNGPLFIIDALQWLLFSPEALPRDSECQGHSLLELHVANARGQNDGWGMLLLLMGAFNPKRARIPAEDVLSPVELERKSWKLLYSEKEAQRRRSRAPAVPPTEDSPKGQPAKEPKQKGRKASKRSAGSKRATPSAEDGVSGVTPGSGRDADVAELQEQRKKVRAHTHEINQKAIKELVSDNTFPELSESDINTYGYKYANHFLCLVLGYTGPPEAAQVLLAETVRAKARALDPNTACPICTRGALVNGKFKPEQHTLCGCPFVVKATEDGATNPDPSNEFLCNTAERLAKGAKVGFQPFDWSNDQYEKLRGGKDNPNFDPKASKKVRVPGCYNSIMDHFNAQNAGKKQGSKGKGKGKSVPSIQSRVVMAVLANTLTAHDMSQIAMKDTVSQVSAKGYADRTGKVVSASPLLTDKIDSSKIPALDKLEKRHSVKTMVTHQVTPGAIIGSISKKLKEDIKKKVKNQKPAKAYQLANELVCEYHAPFGIACAFAANRSGLAPDPDANSKLAIQCKEIQGSVCYLGQTDTPGGADDSTSDEESF